MNSNSLYILDTLPFLSKIDDKENDKKKLIFSGYCKFSVEVHHKLEGKVETQFINFKENNQDNSLAIELYFVEFPSGKTFLHALIEGKNYFIHHNQIERLIAPSQGSNPAAANVPYLLLDFAVVNLQIYCKNTVLVGDASKLLQSLVDEMLQNLTPSSKLETQTDSEPPVSAEQIRTLISKGEQKREETVNEILKFINVGYQDPTTVDEQIKKWHDTLSQTVIQESPTNLSKKLAEEYEKNNKDIHDLMPSPISKNKLTEEESRKLNELFEERTENFLQHNLLQYQFYKIPIPE